MSETFIDDYQWNYRSQLPSRPGWFNAWPEGARLALHFIVLYEWESNPWHRSRPMPANAPHKFDFLALGGREYGMRHGIWRLLDVFDRHAVKTTIVANGLAAELFPGGVQAAYQQGHEIASHQWDQSVFPYMFTSRDEERASLVRSVQALESVTGGRVQGYMSPGPRPTPHTLDLLAELGFRWTADYIDADFPYQLSLGRPPIVAISYATPGFIDVELLPHGAVHALAEMKNAFDATLEESQQRPMKFCYAVHVHWGGTVAMVRMLDEFLGYVRSRADVWIPRCTDLADFWTANSNHSAAMTAAGDER